MSCKFFLEKQYTLFICFTFTETGNKPFNSTLKYVWYSKTIDTMDITRYVSNK